MRRGVVDCEGILGIHFAVVLAVDLVVKDAS